MSNPTECAKWRHLVLPYVQGNGIELATGGDPINPSSIQFELPAAEYAKYNSDQPLRGVVQWRSVDAIYNLPFKDETLDYVASSHLIEDFSVWAPLLREWIRVLKPHGRLVICAPEKKRWQAAIAAGQCPNCSHAREPYLGDFTKEVKRLKLPLNVLVEKLTDFPKGDYNILFAATKL